MKGKGQSGGGDNSEIRPINSKGAAEGTDLAPLVQAMHAYTENPQDWRSLSEIYEAASALPDEPATLNDVVPEATAPAAPQHPGGPRLTRLSDGRNLAWRSYGAADGAPVVLLASPNSSSLQPAWIDAAAQDEGVRLIAVERPGVGRSSPNPKGGPETLADDLAAVLDGLGIGRVGIMGHATGALYALAAAEGLGDRTTAVLLRSARLAPAGPASHGHRVSRSFFRAVVRTPWFARISLAILSSRMSDSLLRDLSAGFFKASPVDQARLAADPPLSSHIAASMREAVANGFGGLLSESQAIAAGPRAFALTAPVHVWHGREDMVIPPAAVQAWLSRAKPASLKLLPDEGHLLQSSLWPEAFRLMTALKDQPAGRRTPFPICCGSDDEDAGNTVATLSPREAAVLTMLAHGRRPDQIGHLLGITRATVDLHGRNARRKLGAGTLTETVAIAIRLGLI